VGHMFKNFLSPGIRDAARRQGANLDGGAPADTGTQVGEAERKKKASKSLLASLSNTTRPGMALNDTLGGS
jgi:hypothetical protein